MDSFQTQFKANIDSETWEDIIIDIKTKNNNARDTLAGIIGVGEDDLTAVIATQTPGVVFFGIKKGVKLELWNVIMKDPMKREIEPAECIEIHS